MYINLLYLWIMLIYESTSQNGDIHTLDSASITTGYWIIMVCNCQLMPAILSMWNHLPFHPHTCAQYPDQIQWENGNVSLYN